jgi:hypothetical protein
MSRGLPEEGTVEVFGEARPARRYPDGTVEYETMDGRWFLANPRRVFCPKAAS